MFQVCRTQIKIPKIRKRSIVDGTSKMQFFKISAKFFLNVVLQLSNYGTDFEIVRNIEYEALNFEYIFFENSKHVDGLSKSLYFKFVYAKL